MMSGTAHNDLIGDGNYSFDNNSSAGVGVRVYASFYAGWYRIKSRL